MPTRTAINPVSWSRGLGFDQAELVEGPRRLLVCSGQDAVDGDGSPQHPDDMGAQLELALDNVRGVLEAADMTFADVVRLNVFTTDVGEFARHWKQITDRFETDDPRFATSILGVTQLFAPQLLVLLEATAVA